MALTKIGIDAVSGAIGTTQLTDNAVTSAKIAAGAVGTTDIADNAITSAKIDSSYTTAITTNPQFSGTESIKVPVGTTAQRPASPAVGMVRYNTTVGCLEQYTVNGWVGIATPPSITSVSPTTFSGEQGTSFTINGQSFESSALVKFIDNAGVEYNAASVTFVNNSQLHATTPQDFTVAQEPLKVKVINSTGLSYTLENAIDCGSTPTWTTSAGSIGTVTKGSAVSTSVVASDPDSGATISYALTSGALPSGVSLNTSTGAITGTAPAPAGSSTTYNFNITPTDNAGNAGSSRAFSMVVTGNTMYQPAGTTRLAAISFDNSSSYNQNTGSNTVTVTGTFSYPAGGPMNSSYYATGWNIGSNYMQVQSMNPMSSSNYTFIAWYKGTQTNTLNLTWNADVTVFGDPRGSVYLGLGLSSGKISVGYNGQTRGTTTVADNNWHMLAWVFRSNRYVDAYVDGVLEINGVDCVTYAGQAYADYIGEGYHYSGALSASALDGIQVYSGSLTSTQIQQIYNGG